MFDSSPDPWRECDLPRIDARGLSWSAFKKRGLRGSLGVILTGLFSPKELAHWKRDLVLAAHGNETFNADDSRGSFSFPMLADYIEEQHADKTIFTSDSLFGVFGKAMSAAMQPPRDALLRDFVRRPIFSVGVAGSGVPKHGAHWETWHALLQGSKAWWLGPPDPPDFKAWEDPCGQLEMQAIKGNMPSGVRFCIQNEGDILYFGDSITHSNCVLQPFVIGVGAQGHTESWPKLVRAANRGDASAVESILRRRGRNASKILAATAGLYKRTALHHAALHGYTSVVASLLSRDADVHVPDAHGLPVIFSAVHSGHVEVAQQLIVYRSNLETTDPKGAQVLQWAATQGHVALVDMFVVRYGMNVHARNLLGGGSISAAATMGHTRVMALLLEHKADVMEKDAKGMRPLHWASGHGHAHGAALLLKRSASASATAENGQRPLDLALAHGHHAVAQILRKSLPKRRQRGQERSEF